MSGELDPVLFFVFGVIACALAFGPEFYRRGRDCRRWNKKARTFEQRLRDREMRDEAKARLEAARKAKRK